MHTFENVHLKYTPGLHFQISKYDTKTELLFTTFTSLRHHQQCSPVVIPLSVNVYITNIFDRETITGWSGLAKIPNFAGLET